MTSNWTQLTQMQSRAGRSRKSIALLAPLHQCLTNRLGREHSPRLQPSDNWVPMNANHHWAFMRFSLALGKHCLQ